MGPESVHFPPRGLSCCLTPLPILRGHRVSLAKCSSAFLPTDVDECANANGGCEGPCCNTVGGFYCRCPPGYQLQGDGKTCQGRTCLVLCPGEGQRQRVGGGSRGKLKLELGAKTSTLR